MAVDHIRYDILAQDALRGVVRTVLADAAKNGLPGEHHFYITFDTRADGVRLSPRMLAQYPEEMTIVLQHQFWDLMVTDGAASRSACPSAASRSGCRSLRGDQRLSSIRRCSSACSSRRSRKAPAKPAKTRTPQARQCSRCARPRRAQEARGAARPPAKSRHRPTRPPGRSACARQAGRQSRPIPMRLSTGARTTSDAADRTNRSGGGEVVRA